MTLHTGCIYSSFLHSTVFSNVFTNRHNILLLIFLMYPWCALMIEFTGSQIRPRLSQLWPDTLHWALVNYLGGVLSLYLWRVNLVFELLWAHMALSPSARRVNMALVFKTIMIIIIRHLRSKIWKLVLVTLTFMIVCLVACGGCENNIKKLRGPK